LHTWYGLSANLRCRSETCCAGLAANTGRKVVKKSPSAHHRTTLSGYIFATKAHIDNRKKNLLSSNTSSACSHNMVNLGPLAAEISPVVWDTRANFNGFHVLAVGYCTALQYWALAKLCGIEQRVPPTFGRAATTLGIGPHSSSQSFSFSYRAVNNSRKDGQ